jgi:hypothetical protein
MMSFQIVPHFSSLLDLIINPGDVPGFADSNTQPDDKAETDSSVPCEGARRTSYLVLCRPARAFALLSSLSRYTSRGYEMSCLQAGQTQQR